MAVVKNPPCQSPPLGFHSIQPQYFSTKYAHSNAEWRQASPGPPLQCWGAGLMRRCRLHYINICVNCHVKTQGTSSMIRKVGFCNSVKTHVKTQPTSSMIRKMGFCKSVKTHVKARCTSSIIRKVCFFNAKTLPRCFGLHNKRQFPKTVQNIDVLIKLHKTIIFISLFRPGLKVYCPYPPLWGRRRRR